VKNGRWIIVAIAACTILGVASRKEISAVFSYGGTRSRNESSGFAPGIKQKGEGNSAGHGAEPKQVSTPPLTDLEQQRVAASVMIVEMRFREIERANAVMVFQADLEHGSIAIVRIKEPDSSQVAEISKIIREQESMLDDSKHRSKVYGQKVSALWNSYLMYPPERPYRVVQVMTQDEGTTQYEGAPKTWSMDGYFHDERSTIPSASGSLVFPDDSLGAEDVWDKPQSWAKQRYRHLFEFHGNMGDGLCSLPPYFRGSQPSHAIRAVCSR
jgi:hypothetical protein